MDSMVVASVVSDVDELSDVSVVDDSDVELTLSDVVSSLDVVVSSSFEDVF